MRQQLLNFTQPDMKLKKKRLDSLCNEITSEATKRHYSTLKLREENLMEKHHLNAIILSKTVIKMNQNDLFAANISLKQFNFYFFFYKIFEASRKWSIRKEKDHSHKLDFWKTIAKIDVYCISCDAKEMGFFFSRPKAWRHILYTVCTI